MIRTVITPKNTDLHISIPKNYVGKQIEVLLYTTDEVKEKEEANFNNAARFKGLLTDKEAKKYHQYLKKIRSKWERSI